MNTIKSIIFLFFDFAGINYLFRKLNKGRLVVLMYHNVGPSRDVFSNSISGTDFEKQLVYLKSRYNIISLDSVGNWVGTSDSRMNILITFDDGFINNYETAAPILAKHNIKASFFLIANCLESGDAPDFEKNKELKTMTSQHAKELLDQGHFIGCHSLSHQDYTKLSADEAVTDATAALDKFNSILNIKASGFAFPWGKYNKDQLKPLSNIFKKIFTTDHGINELSSEVLSRQEVDNIWQLKSAASGSLAFMNSLLGRR